jgi:glucose-1-phosphate cytidylyltransferase
MESRDGPLKVVIFCGGLGVRMGEATQSIPKPMIRIGDKPILWHIMRYYAAWGHNEFILCLGYKGDVVKEYFLSYNEALFNDFVLERNGAGAEINILTRDTAEWRITFAETGINATIGERLKAVERYLSDDDEFLATYGDGLTDAPLPEVIKTFRERQATATFLLVRPEYVGHLVRCDEAGNVVAVEQMRESDVRINGGFFVFRRQILDLINPGEELVEEPFARLIARRELVAYPYEGFFCPMDTIKDRQRLEALYESGSAPWRHVGLDALEERVPL